MFRIYKNWRLWTNIFFFLPLGLALQSRLYWYAAILGASISLSLLYHASVETKFKKTDIFFAWVLMGANACLLIIGALQPMWLAILDILTAGAAIYVFTNQTPQNYWLTHNIYHFLAAGICTASILVFVL